MKGSWDLWSITWTGACRAAGAFLLFTEPAQKRKSVILWSLSSNRPDTQPSDICVLSFAPGAPRVSTVCSAALTSPLTPGQNPPTKREWWGLEIPKRLWAGYVERDIIETKQCWGGKGRIVVPSFWICGCLFFSNLAAQAVPLRRCTTCSGETLRGEESQPALRSPRTRFLYCDGAAPHVVVN